MGPRNQGSHFQLHLYVPKAGRGVWFFFFFNFFNTLLFPFLNFIYLFLAVLGLRCCTRAFSSCGEQRLLFVAVRGLLIAVASLVVEHGL